MTYREILSGFFVYCVTYAFCHRLYCLEPPNLRQAFMEINYNSGSGSGYFPPSLIPEYTRDPIPLAKRDISYYRDFPVPKRDVSEYSCPRTSSASDLLRDRSLCPWRYVPDHDSNRFPATILEAVPICPCCTGIGNVCERLFRSLKVLIRRTDSCYNGTYQYYETTQRFAIATLCARRRETAHTRNGFLASRRRTRIYSGPNQAVSM